MQTSFSKQLSTIFRLLIIFLLLENYQFSIAQQQSIVRGYPYLHQFSPDQYGAHKQNWDVVQDDKGIMYIANGHGLLIYDGLQWKLLEMPEKTMVQSLDKDKNGQIYIGAFGHFGKIEYDAKGNPQFLDFVGDLADTIDITRVFSTICLDSAVYFQTAEAVFRYLPDQPLKVWYMGNHALGKLFKVNGNLYLKEHKRGISRLEGDIWKWIPGSERFGPVFVHFMISLNDHDILLDGGDSLWVFNGQSFKHFPTQADKYFKDHKFYCSISLVENGILIGTVTGGIVHINSIGKIQMILAEDAGLNSLNIREFYRDINGVTWVAMDVGLAMLEYPSSETLFKFKSKNLSFKSFSRFHSNLYVASDAGLWKLNQDNSGGEFFSKVPGIDHKIWKIDSIAGKLLIATEFGLYSMNADESMSLLISGVVTGFSFSKYNPRMIYIFRQNGIMLVNIVDGNFIIKDIFPEFIARTRNVVEISPTEIWLDTDWTELWKINFAKVEDFNSFTGGSLQKIDTSNNLPEKRGLIYALNKQLYFVPSDLDGNYLWNTDHEEFQRVSLDNILPGKIDSTATIWEVDRAGNCTYVSNYGTGWEKMELALNDGGMYRKSDVRFGKILQDIGECQMIEKDGIWFGGIGNIVYQELNSNVDTLPFNTLLDQVIVFEDSLLISSTWATLSPSIVYKRNRIEFHYSTSDYASNDQMLFQTYLEGDDRNWSDFTNANSKQYFGLEPGKYTFKVRALNREGVLGEATSMTFSILTPWQKKWWAYLLFLTSIVFSIIGTAKWRNRTLLKDKFRLESKINEHTQALQERNIELQTKTALLEAQAEKLRELDQLKTNLFANISHEFRTPLTLIKAPVDQLEFEPEKIITTEEAGMIRRNADRLLRLVNQLLDLAKLDAKSLQLEPTEGDVFRFFRIEASSFSSLAAQKNIDFEIKIPSDQLWASFDREKLETIIYNLLTNAFKFTPTSGKIKLSVSYLKDILKIEVSDSGTGIAQEHHELVFDRFYQIKEVGKISEGGTGIGLSLCRELIHLMKGRIQVKSAPGRGTAFLIDLPLIRIINPPDNINDSPIIHHSNERGASRNKNPSDTRPIILIVEDHPEMRSHISAVLEEQYSVMEAGDGNEGLSKAINEIPDLIITDTMMPLMDGHQFSEKIKNHECTSHIPVLMLTAKATLENKLTGLAAGVDAYLTKPFNVLELKSSIEALLKERKRLRKIFSGQLLVSPKDIVINTLDQQFLEKLLNVLEANYSDSTFGLPQMQKALAISKTQLHRKLTAIAGQSSGEFLRNFRLQRAAQILSKKGETVTQVAFAVGFENVPYFTKCFKDLFGMPPSKYTE
ncbi:MAG: response regulator [Saprospiraceae bacterium]|nr:response regulator [Saprospiraceae bacterium]